MTKDTCLNIKTSHKRITLDELQRIFLDIAQKECDEMLLSFRGKIAEDYTNRLDALESDFFGLFDGYAQWKREIKDGYILRILKYVGAYDGDKIDKDRLLTAITARFKWDNLSPCVRQKRKRTYQALFSYLTDHLMELILHIQRRFAYGNQHR